MFKFISFITLMIFSNVTHAAFYIYDASDKKHKLGSVKEDPGFYNALTGYINNLVGQWRPGDAIRIDDNIGGEAYRIYNANGKFTKISMGEAYAIGVSDGVIILRRLDENGNEVIFNAGGDGFFGAVDSGDDTTDGIEDPFYRDPLIIDLGQDGFHMRSNRFIHYDYDGQGIPTITQWVAPNGNEAFIFLDLNHNGLVDNGTELFGDTMLMLGTGQAAMHGFEALAQYNNAVNGGNDDNNINYADAIWPHLKLWLDSDANGISTPDEIMSLYEANVSSISLQTKQSHRRDSNGNLFPFWSWAKNTETTGNSKHKVADVFFRAIEDRPEFIAPISP